jgi:type IV fimbrial biogenesis protein FimT
MLLPATSYKLQAPHRPAFTMGEILAVLAVMAVIVTIAAPSFSGLQARYVLGGAAKDLAGDLRYTQQRSVTEQQPYELRIDTVARNYSVVRLGSPETTVKSTTFDAAVTVDSPTGLNANRVSFNSSGAPSNSGDVVLIHSGGTIATVSVRPSGFVTVQ